MAEPPLLDLDTLIVRQTIAIDGQSYEIRNPDELSVMDSHRFSRWGRRIEQVADSDGEDDAEEYSALIDQVARAAVVDLPDDVFARLAGAQKLAIHDVFTGLLLRNRLRAAGAMATAMATGGLPIGETSSPGSSASTADGRTGGWWKRLLRWCGLS